MKDRVRPWVRMFAAEANAGEVVATGQGSAPSQHTPQEPAGAGDRDGDVEKQEEPESGDDEEDDNPDGRGSKRAVLKDLAAERDKRQAAEAARDELQERLDAIDREKMTDLERTQADLEKANARIAELEAAATAREREQLVSKVLTEAKLPAEMADRLRGETEEELAADAKTLAAALGFDRKPVDPSQGQGTQRAIKAQHPGRLRRHRHRRVPQEFCHSRQPHFRYRGQPCRWRRNADLLLPTRRNPALGTVPRTQHRVQTRKRHHHEALRRPEGARRLH